MSEPKLFWSDFSIQEILFKQLEDHSVILFCHILFEKSNATAKPNFAVAEKNLECSKKVSDNSREWMYFGPSRVKLIIKLLTIYWHRHHFTITCDLTIWQIHHPSVICEVSHVRCPLLIYGITWMSVTYQWRSSQSRGQSRNIIGFCPLNLDTGNSYQFLNSLVYKYFLEKNLKCGQWVDV